VIPDEPSLRVSDERKPGAVAAVRRMNMDIDVRSMLPAVHMQTLVLHRPADAPDAAETNDIPKAHYFAEVHPKAGSQEVPELGASRCVRPTSSGCHGEGE
jgi:hypothetical protein